MTLENSLWLVITRSHRGSRGRKDNWILMLKRHFSGRRLYTPVPSNTLY